MYKKFSFNWLVSDIMGHVDLSLVRHAIIVTVTVLSCGRLGFSGTAILPFLCMAGLLVNGNIRELHSAFL